MWQSPRAEAAKEDGIRAAPEASLAVSSKIRIHVWAAMCKTESSSHYLSIAA
jgi:hypothetical protein